MRGALLPALLLLAGAPVSALTLAEAVREALDRSPGVARARLDAESAGLEEPLLLSNTDPLFSAGYSLADDRAPRAQPAFQGPRSRLEAYDLSVAGKTLIGTEAKLFWRGEKLRNPAAFRPIDPTADSRLTLEVRQSLLRRFWGRPDKALRGQARSGVRAARERVRLAESEQAAAAARAYVAFYAAEEGVRIAEEGLAAARRLLELYGEKRRYGLVEESDQLQARVSVEIHETELSLATTARARAGNALLTALQRQSPGEAPVPPAERPRAEWRLPGSLEEAVRLASSRRPEALAAEAALERAEWSHRLDRLDTIPDLAVFGSYGLAGLDTTYKDAWDDAAGADHPVKSAGVAFSVAFGQKKERLTRQAARLRRDAARREREDASQRILGEVRDAWEARRLAEDRLASSRRLVELEEKKLASERRNFDRGRSSTDLLIRFQQDVHRAEKQRLQAEADDLLARVELARATGTLVEALLEEGTR